MRADNPGSAIPSRGHRPLKCTALERGVHCSSLSIRKSLFVILSSQAEVNQTCGRILSCFFYHFGKQTNARRQVFEFIHDRWTVPEPTALVSESIIGSDHMVSGPQTHQIEPTPLP